MEAVYIFWTSRTETATSGVSAAIVDSTGIGLVLWGKLSGLLTVTSTPSVSEELISDLWGISQIR